MRKCLRVLLRLTPRRFNNRIQPARPIRQFIGRWTALIISGLVISTFSSTQAFALLGTTTTVVSSTNPSAAGASVTFTATVTGVVITPTGTVTFKDGATTIGTGTVNGSGVATFSTTALSVGSHSITAVYGGDTVYNPSTSSVLTQNVTANATSTAVVSSANPSALNQSVIFTATVTSAGGTPTGTITFKDGATTLGTGTLDGSGQTTFATSVLTPGNHDITAVYSGDSNFSAGSSPVLTQTVNLGTSSTAVISSSNPSSVGQAVTFTATVSGLVVQPTGTVTFKDGATTLGTGTLNASGIATFTTSSLTQGSHSITAVYGGDTLYNSSTSNLLTQDVNQASTATAVVSSANPSALGASVTFTATVTSSGGTPTGTVTFKDGTATLGTGTLNGSGVATYSTSALTTGSHSITAVYGGDSNFTGSTSSVLTQQVTANDSATALTSSVNPSNFGAAVTFTATVTSGGGTPTGTVTFKDGATTLGTGTLNGSGVATYSTNALTAGSHSITAVYGGDSNFATSTSPTVTQVVNQNTTTTTVASSANPSAYGAAVTFTATVTGTGVTPTGTITFKDGTTTIGTGTLNGSGQTTLSTSSLAAGSHSITAVYGGDGNYTGSTSTVLTQVVGQSTATVALTSSNNPSYGGEPVTLTATVTASGGTPTGSVTFYDGGAALGTVALTSGSAALTLSSLSIGSHSITAVYGGDSNFSGATSPALTQTVGEPPDSWKLRRMQLGATPIIAQASGSAISGAIDSAIDEGFDDNCEPLTGSPSGVRLVSCPDDNTGARVSNGFAAFNEPRFPAPIVSRRSEWRAWADMRGSRWNTDASQGDITGRQINALAGLTRRVTPDFLVGGFAGYEVYSYTSDNLTAKLSGGGWTVGSYLGWRFVPGLRFDAGLAYSSLDFEAAAGTAQASIAGSRVLAKTGLTGTYRFDQNWELQPSARLFALWQSEKAYTDSLGTPQAEHKFMTGRGSAGAKLSYRFRWRNNISLVPYLGVYADYYFSKEDDGAADAAAPSTDGAAARVQAGLALRTGPGTQISLDGEAGGLVGGKFTAWSMRSRASVAF